MSTVGNKYKIARKFPELLWRFGVKQSCPKDKAVADFIVSKTGWPSPSKKERKRFFVRFLNEFCGENERYPGRQPRKARPPRVSRNSGKGFYMSDEWRALRYQVLKVYGSTCHCCGATPTDGRQVHVDHIKPRSKYPELELSFDNLQVLCEACNLGKMHHDETDWRPKKENLPDGAEEHLQSIN